MSLLVQARRAVGADAATAGTARDAVNGVVPEVVAHPPDAESLARLLAATAEQDAAVVVRGGGSKLDRGAPPRRLDLLVDLTGLHRVRLHSPGDLVVRVEAGMRLAALQTLLRDSGQRLALDPPEADATLGGVLAADASGPLRLAFGTVRDLLLGATLVLADGRIVRTGGNVVKNVAGYDLAKIAVGTLGTFAIVTELALRLHPRPAGRRVVTRSLASLTEAPAIRDLIRDSDLVPSAIELRAGPGKDAMLEVLFEGRAADVQAAQAAAMVGGDIRAEPSAQFGALPYGPAEVGLKITHPVAAFALLSAWQAEFAAAIGHPVSVAAHAASGVAWFGGAVAGSGALADAVAGLRRRVGEVGGQVTVVQAGPGDAGGLDVWGPVPEAPLLRRLKDRFDPTGRLAPGRLPGD